MVRAGPPGAGISPGSDWTAVNLGGCVGDSRLKVVSIMNYPPEPRYRRMGYAFLDSVIAHGAESITLLYDDYLPVIAPEHRRAADI